MVAKRYIITIFTAFFHISSIAQNSFFDEIHLMDYQRNFQLTYDTSRKMVNSFMIRSTSTFQHIQDKVDKKSKILSNP